MTTLMELTDVESAILAYCLAGDHPTMRVLRAQLAYVTVVKREFTGVGFHADLGVDAGAPRIAVGKGSFTLSHVAADVPSLKNGLGFALFVEEGAMRCWKDSPSGRPIHRSSMDSHSATSGSRRNCKHSSQARGRLDVDANSPRGELSAKDSRQSPARDLLGR